MNDVALLTDRLIVMNGSRLAMNGTPREVFAHARDLADMGLDIPEVTQIFLELQNLGLKLPPVYTMEQALDALKGGIIGALGHYFRSVFPWNFYHSPVGSPNKACVAGCLYCRALSCSRTCFVWIDARFFAHLHPYFSSARKGIFERNEAAGMYSDFYRCFEPFLYTRRKSFGVLLGHYHYTGRRSQSGLYGGANFNVDCRNLFADLHHFAHCAD